MSIDWQILEETKKNWYRKGLWRGILISIIIITAIYLFMNLTNFSSNFSHIARININGIIFDNSEIVEIINTDINVDFDKALDYVEPPPKQEVKPAWIPTQTSKNVKISQDISGSTIHNRRLNQYKKTGGFVPFSGKGNVLGRK